MTIPIENQKEVKEFFLKHLSSGSSNDYLTYLRNAAADTGKDKVCSNGFSPAERIIQELESRNVASDRRSKSCAAIELYNKYLQEDRTVVFRKLENQIPRAAEGQIASTAYHPVIEFFKGNGNSKSQEKFAEYSFLRDLIIAAAGKHKKLGISRSDFDAFGFDVLLEYDNRFYPIQLKAVNGKAANWDIHKEFLKKENSRVVVVEVIESDNAISTKYKVLAQEKVPSVIATAPKKAHEAKCKVKKGDLIDVSSDLLSIF